MGFGVPAVVLHLWSVYVDVLDLRVLSASCMLLAGGALMGGRRGCRILLLPAVFLLLLVPLPGVLLNAIVYPMQLVLTQTTSGIVAALGFDVVSRGDQMVTRSGMFHVIETCSGLRIIETLTMSAFLYAELFYRSRRQVMILIAAGPIVGLLVNQVRVLSMVANPYSYVSSVHTVQGVIMLVGGVLLIAAIDRVLARVDPLVEERVSWAHGKDAPPVWRGSERARLALLVGCLVVLGAAAQGFQPFAPGVTNVRPLYTLPSVIDDWRGDGIEIPEQFLGSTRFTESLQRAYGSDPGEVRVFLGGHDRLDRYTSLLSPKTLVFHASGFVEEVLDPPDAAPLAAGTSLAVSDPQRAIVQTWSERFLVQRWYLDVGSLPEEVARAAMALDRSPVRRPGRAVVVRLEVPIDRETGDVARAQATLDAFLPPFLERLGRVVGDPSRS